MNLSRRKKNFLNPIRLQQLLAVMVLICFVSCSQRDTKKEVRPNVVFILADDLGYGETKRADHSFALTRYGR